MASESIKAQTEKEQLRVAQREGKIRTAAQSVNCKEEEEGALRISAFQALCCHLLVNL